MHNILRVHALYLQAVDHPRAVGNSSVVKMDVFYSMWRCKTVPCPWGTDKPAVETLLLHHEQFKIPENLSRFAVRHGMWGFVKKMNQSVPAFVAARRARGVPSDEHDPSAFGAGVLPNPPIDRMPSRTISCALSLSSMNGSSSNSSFFGSIEGSEAGSDIFEAKRGSNKLRRLATIAIAGSVALLLNRKGGKSCGGGGHLNHVKCSKPRALPRSSSAPSGLLGPTRGRGSHSLLIDLETE